MNAIENLDLRQGDTGRFIALILLFILLLIPVLIYFKLFGPVVTFGSKHDICTTTAALIFYIIVLKYLQSYIIFRVIINRAKKDAEFGRSFGMYTLKKEDVDEWGIRKIKNNFMQSSFKYQHYFEAKLHNGEQFIYPLDEFGRGNLNEDDYINGFKSTFDSDPKELKIIKGYGLLNFFDALRYQLSVFFI